MTNLERLLPKIMADEEARYFLASSACYIVHCYKDRPYWDLCQDGETSHADVMDALAKWMLQKAKPGQQEGADDRQMDLFSMAKEAAI